MLNIWKHINNNAWILIPLSATIIQLLLFMDSTISSMSVSTKVIMSLADTLLVYVLFAFTPVRFNKITIWIPGLAITVFCIVNSIYFKAFSDLCNIEAIRLAPSVDSIIMRSATSLFSVTEFLLMSVYILEILLLYLFPKVKWTVVSKRGKAIYIASAICALLLTTILSVRRAGIYRHAKSMRENIVAYKESWSLQTTKIAYYNIYGLHGFVVHTILDFEVDAPLSEYEATEIKSFMQQNVLRDANPLLEVFQTRNNDKNLIFIVVESLTSDVLIKHKFRENLPTLDSLLNDTSTISALRLIPQTGPGRSSDGQFIYNTGLLPLKRVALVESHAHADYPSVAKALGRQHNIEVIGESKNMWRHFLTSRSYGFDTLYDMVAPDNFNADEKIFGKVSSIIDTLPQPFFILATTLSMHHPYDKPSVDVKHMRQSNFGLSDARDINYFIDTAAFDFYLGVFIENLKRRGIYDDCIIVIASDHEPGRTALSDDIDNSYIAFLILNAGYGMKIEHEIRQVDLFPTILDIMGIQEYTIPSLGTPYHGLGRSVFKHMDIPKEKHSKSELNTLDSIQAHYSERLIMSRIFEN